MAKRNWPDHPGIGKTINYDGHRVTVVDIKAGPMTFNPAELANSSVVLHGTLKLRVKYEGGKEVWTPPVDGEQFLKFCERQDAKEKTA